MFRVTRQTDYAILLLATCVVGERSYTARELAHITGLTLPMVSKVLKLLAGHGFLTSQLGAKGGYTLARAPETVTVADIVAALEGPVALTMCSDKEPGACEHECSCPVRDHWQTINQILRDALESITLEKLAAPYRIPTREAVPAAAGGADSSACLPWVPPTEPRK